VNSSGSEDNVLTNNFQSIPFIDGSSVTDHRFLNCPFCSDVPISSNETWGRRMILELRHDQMPGALEIEEIK
jgi:hypothetical protein